MCGIAGALDLRGRREFPAARLLAMTAAIAHRGPEDEQVHIEPGVALGARRLAIVDLAGGRQPLCNEDGTVWVAQNGEIFEYPEIQQELLARGHTLSTRCDTELWVHLYEDLGRGMFDKARGQYAVSLWDRKERALFLGRDRVGICPLYYAEVDGWLLWGSEIKAILASGMIDARADRRGIDVFFNTFCASTSRTFFEGINILSPGHFLAVKDGRIETIRYWDLDFPDAGDERRLKDPTPLIDELEHLMRQAVERRLRGDVPVVSYISGGLDSTVVLGLSSRQRGYAVPSFTIGLNKAGPDERSQAVESAEALGSKLTMVTMDRADIINAYPELIRAAEGPVMDSSAACLMRLAKAVHDQGYKVALTGEGADEALAGYPWFKSQQVRNVLRRTVGNWAPSKIRDVIVGSMHGDPAHLPPRHGFQGVRTAQQDVYDLMGQARTFLYSGAMWSDLGAYSAYDDLDISNERFTRWAPLNQSLYVGYKVMLAGLLLHGKGDRVAMNSSVEARYPLLDEDVVAFCASIAPEYKLKGLTDKWILRQVAARTLPKKIANRPKTMFRASRSEAFFDAGRPAWVDQLLSPESLRRTGYFDVESVAREVASHGRFPKFTPKRIIMDLSLTCVAATQLWHHTFLGGGLCELPTWTPPRSASADLPDGLDATSYHGAVASGV
ncbi:asparagine synthase (glutamine-hydrolyzing) [Paludisphaera mucosa]|uniref:asparagine synthase (glutamine-hydrolyzing) n=1 Tax=Paludisphaera mucosa TaxID=3030827 RepID=A0ABT6FH57_9BACT|nr:asparagine synthase (glutamine-hydrolyzing) [Paludisphaera mucosa]MDG3006907.1 asparagine synthase (glutamine-hydrolyzing) [Paludisphaera mucosa]